MCAPCGVAVPVIVCLLFLSTRCATLWLRFPLSSIPVKLHLDTMPTPKAAASAFSVLQFTLAGEAERPNTIQHWQLRDLIKAGLDSEYQVYCVANSCTIRYDTLTGEVIPTLGPNLNP